MDVTLGFMPLFDSAVVVVAAEKGFASDEGLDLTLDRETSWANIRDRIAVGHFQAATCWRRCRSPRTWDCQRSRRP